MKKKITVPIYGSVLYIYNDLEHMCKDADIEPNTKGDTDGLTYSEETGHVWMYCHPDACLSTISHEALHAAWYVLAFHGVKPKYMNHEALAYLMGWVIDEFQKKFG